MDPVNEARYALIQATTNLQTQRTALHAIEADAASAKKVHIGFLERAQAGPLSAADAQQAARAKALHAGFEPRLAAARDLLAAAERAQGDAQSELVRMEAEAEADSLASRGLSTAGLLGGSSGRDDRAPVSGLPPLPARTRAAISRLYGNASAAPEERREQWQGVLAAAIGGQPLHPAILRASQTESTPADGGFLVTPSVASFIFSRAAESSIFMRIGARVEPMSSSELLVNALDDDDETGDAEANVTAGWTAEGEDQSAQTVKFRQVRLTAAKLTVLAAASNELVEDGGRAVVMALEDALGDAIGKRFDRSILTGTGAGMPLGLLNSPATVTVDKVSGQAASTFLWANAAAMWARLAPGSHERAWWLVHPSVLPQAVSMSLVIGTAGAIPPGSFEAGGPTGYRLLGRPVLVTSRVKALGASGDVILVDPTQIVVGIRRGLAIERSQHAYFSSDRLAIRARFRGDARPLWATPLVPVEGTDTLSPIVVLEDR